MPMQVLFAGVRVRELASAVEWYGRLFGRAPDIVPNENEVMWRVADGGWLYVIEDVDHAGNGLVAITVTNLDDTASELAARGVLLGPIEAVGDSGRKAPIEDADGNSLALIEVAS